VDECKPLVFGRTDRGEKGIDNFFRTHECSELCRGLMKSWIDPKARVPPADPPRNRR